MLTSIEYKRHRLYDTAYLAIGRDASPKDYAPDDLGCAESLSNVIQLAFNELHFPTLLSTKDVYNYLTKSPSFSEIDEPVYGAIILSVTGTGSGAIQHGHVGVVGQNFAPDGTFWVMSNDSRTGTWEVNFSVGLWKKYYEQRGGMKTHYFIPV